MGPEIGRVFAFADVEFDFGAREVRRSGAPVAVEPQVFDLISLLITRHGQVVTKDEIIEQVWDGRFVSDSAVSSRINASRKALGDDGKAQRFIKTVHGRGFRFVAEDGAAVIEGAPEAPDKPSIAILPFRNLSGDPEQEFFADGITEDIINALSKISRMRVIARNSAFAYKGQARDLRHVAQELGVRYILEGSVRSGGNRLRITAQLIDADDGMHLWADRYDRKIDDIFDIQDEITKEIITNLRINLTDGETVVALNSRPTDIEAWQLTGQGFDLQDLFHEETNLRAREMGERACRIDPDYGPAWALIGLTYWYESRIGSLASWENNLDKAEDCFKRARSTDPDNPYVLELGSEVLSSRGDHEKAIELLRDGLRTNPGSAELRALLGNAYHWAGKHKDSVRFFDEAKQLNPLHAIWYYPTSARAVDACGDEEEALRIVRAGLARQEDNFPCLLHLASLLGRRGEGEEAQKALQKALRLSPNFALRRVEHWLVTCDKSYVALYSEGLRAAGLR